MVSGAGETAARRRRDMTIFLNLFHLSLTVWLLLVSNLCVTPQKYPNLSSPMDFSADGLLCNEGRNRCLTSSVPSKTLLPMAPLNPAKEVPHQPSNAPPPSLELEFIDLPSSSGSSSTFITVSHGGGDSIPVSPTTPTLDPNWMGLSSICGPLSITWPMFQILKEAQVFPIFQPLKNIAYPSPLIQRLRSVPLIALHSLPLKFCSLRKNGRRRFSISATISLDETCFYIYRNLLDKVVWMLPDASFVLKFFSRVMLSSVRGCCKYFFFDLRHFHSPTIPWIWTQLLHDVIVSYIGPILTSNNLTSAPNSLQLPAPMLCFFDLYGQGLQSDSDCDIETMGLLLSLSYRDAHPLCPYSPPETLRPNQRQLPKRLKLRFGFFFQCQTDYKLCVEFLNLHGRRVHVREDPPVLLRFFTYLLRILDILHDTLTLVPTTSLCFVPANQETKDIFSTSHESVLIVTISKFPDLIVEVSLTHHEVACGLLLDCFGLRFSMAYPSYLSTFVARLCSLNPIVLFIMLDYLVTFALQGSI